MILRCKAPNPRLLKLTGVVFFYELVIGETWRTSLENGQVSKTVQVMFGYEYYTYL